MMRLHTSTSRRGFTLLEVIVVFTILAVLAGVVVVANQDVLDNADERKVEAELRSLERHAMTSNNIREGALPGAALSAAVSRIDSSQYDRVLYNPNNGYVLLEKDGVCRYLQLQDSGLGQMQECVAGDPPPAGTNLNADSDAPTPPTLNTATSDSDGNVDLTWSAPGEADVTGYRIYVNDNLWASVGNVTTYTVSGLSNGETYEFAVTAVDGDGNESAKSNSTAATAYGTTNTDSDTPPPPTTVQAVAGDNEAQVGWSPVNVPDLKWYRVLRDGTQVAEVPADRTSWTDTGVVNGTTYAYTIVSVDRSGNVSDQSNQTTVTPEDTDAPPTPYGPEAAAGDATATFSWTAVSDPDLAGYNVYVDGTHDQTVPVGTTSVTYTALANGTTYAFQVSSVDGEGNESTLSLTAYATPEASNTPPQPPTNVIATASDRAAAISWDPSPSSDVVRYRIGRYNHGNGNNTEITAVPASSTSTVDASVDNSTTYTYYVVAEDTDEATSTPSNSSPVTVPAGPPDPVGATTVANDGDGVYNDVEVTWTAPGDPQVSHYRIYVGPRTVGTSTTTSFTHNNRPSGTYSYTVQTVMLDGTRSRHSDTATVNVDVPPPTPTGFTAEVMDTNGNGGLNDVSLDWDEGASTVASYKILQDSTVVATVSAPVSFYVHEDQPDGTYSYQVVATDDQGRDSSATSPLDVTVAVPPQPPANPSANRTDINGVGPEDDVQISWNSSPSNDVVSYRVLRDDELIATTASGVLTHDDLDLPEGSYGYQLQAVDAGGRISTKTATLTVAIANPPAAPTDITATAIENDADGRTNDVRVTFTASTATDIDHYRIERNGVQVGTTTTTEFIHSNLSEGTHEYYVVAVDDAGYESDPAGPDSVTLTYPPEVPTNVTLVVTAVNGAVEDDVAVSWDDVQAADGYQVFRDGTQIGTNDIARYDDLDLSDGEYTYAVKSTKASGGVSEMSEPATIVVNQPPAAPDGLLVEPDDIDGGGPYDDLRATWDPATEPDVSHYEVEFASTLVDTNASSPWTTLNVEEGTHRVRVRAVDDFGAAGPWSTYYVEVNLPTPAPAFTVHADSTDVHLSWGPPPQGDDVDHYEIFRCDGHCSNPSTSIGTTTDRTYTDTIGSTGQTYSYAVETVTPTGFRSEPTGVRTATTSVWSQLAAGDNHTCGISEQMLFCWGDNSRGQLGMGDTTDLLQPHRVRGISGVQDVAVGSQHTCAVTNSRDTYCFGDNSRGQIGQAGSSFYTSPQKILEFSEAADVAAGDLHTCVVTQRGEARCAGANSSGQLGAGDTTDRNVAEAVTSSSTYVAVAAGSQHTCLITIEQTVECAGANSNGQLGTGSTSAYQDTPQDTTGLTAATQVAAGGNTTCVTTDDGTLYCFGAGSSGQIGDGNGTASNPTPVAVTSITDATINADVGTAHTCTTTDVGALWCFGEGQDGQLGHGGTSDRLTPSQVSGTNLVPVGTGVAHTCFASAVGGPQCTGSNTAGQLGDTTTNSTLTPVAVNDDAASQPQPPTNLSAETATERVWLSWDPSPSVDIVTYNVYRDGTKVGFTTGTSFYESGVTTGQTYNYTVRAVNAAKYVSADSAALSVTVQDRPLTPTGLQAYDRDQGALLQWNKAAAEDDLSHWNIWRCQGCTDIGSATLVATQPAPTAEYQDSGLTNGTTYTYWVEAENTRGATSEAAAGPKSAEARRWVTLVSGYKHTCALRGDGAVFCTGFNLSGQVAVGSGSSRIEQFTQVPTGNVIGVTAGYAHTCFLLADHTAECAGSNDSGQLGNGDVGTTETTPVPVSNLTDVHQIEAGWTHTCAIVGNSREVYCWGDNSRGQLTDPDVGERLVPFKAKELPAGAESIAAGNEYTCAVTTEFSRALYCFGANGNGQLGVGDTTDRTSPTPVSGASSPAVVTSGYGTSTCVTSTSGAVSCFGNNSNGQLGVGDTSNRTTPATISSWADSRQVAPAKKHSCAAQAGGTLSCTGANNGGQLGDGSTTDSSSPVQASTISTADRVATGDWHTCAASPSTVWCFGFNDEGQFGTTSSGTTPNPYPTPISMP